MSDKDGDIDSILIMARDVSPSKAVPRECAPRSQRWLGHGVLEVRLGWWSISLNELVGSVELVGFWEEKKNVTVSEPETSLKEKSCDIGLLYSASLRVKTSKTGNSFKFKTSKQVFLLYRSQYATVKKQAMPLVGRATL